MAEKYLVECVCGGETDAPASAYGQTIECQACGAEVTVSDATIVARGSSKPALNPVAAPVPVTDRPKGASAAVEAAFGPDKDEVEPPKPTASSPIKPLHSPLRENDPISWGPQKCARCGNAFRGSWDEFHTAGGTICYICSNLAVEGVPERVRKSIAEIEEATASDLPPTAPPEHRQTFLGYDTKSPQFQRALLIAAFITIGIAWLVFVTGWGEPEVVGRVRQSSAEPEDVPRWLTIAWAITYRAAIYLVLGLTVYFVLWRRNGLPHETFLRNLLDIGLVIAICAVIGTVAALFGAAIDTGGEIGWVPAAMVYIVGWIIQGLILFFVFQGEILDVFWGMVFFYISRFLVASLLQLIFGALTHLVTLVT